MWLIDLASLGDGRLLESTVAAVCGITEEGKRRTRDVLCDGLAGKRCLLVLDGCEHLVDSCAELAGVLLRSCPKLSIVAASREPLGVTGEVTWRTPSLTVPRLEDEHRPELLMESEAIRLFVERARLSRSDFEVRASNAAPLVQICQRLEGIPLAIELAAGLSGFMSLTEILDRLHHRFRLLTGGGRGSLPRHQTLRQAVDWSYGLLDPAEQALFTRLAVFAGGFDLAAAEAVVPGQPIAPEDVMPLLSRLVNKSLVMAEPGSPDVTRYRMLDTIREYALEKLQPQGEAEWRRRHAEYFTGWSAMATQRLTSGEQGMWLRRLDEEQPNIRIALEWTLVEQPDYALRLAADMGALWRVNCSLAEGYEWLTRALETEASDQEARVAALMARARLSRRMGDLVRARADAESSVDLARRANLRDRLSAALTMLGIASSHEGDTDSSARYFAEAKAIAEEIHDLPRIAGCLNNMAMIELARGRNPQALEYGLQAIAICEELGDRILKSLILDTVARTHMHLGNLDEARRRYAESLVISQEFSDPMNIADCLEGMALLAMTTGDGTRGITLVAAAEALRTAMGIERTFEWSAEVLSAATRAQARVGEPAAAAARQKGAAMTMQEAVQYSLGASHEERRNGPSRLTGREVQVARLVSAGLTNAEIAQRLRISGRTVDAHVEHIRNKLGLRTRTQIAVWTRERVGTP